MIDILSFLITLNSIIITFLLVFGSSFGIAYLIVVVISFVTSKKLSTLFQICFGNSICQRSSILSPKKIRAKRKDCDDKFLRMKMQYISSFLIAEFKEAFSNLEIGKEYTTKTHIKAILLKAEKQGYIKIHSIKPCKKRYLYEAIILLGISDFLKILRYSHRRKQLYKQFYKITFTRIR